MYAALKNNVWEFIDLDTLRDKLLKLVELIEPTPVLIHMMSLNQEVNNTLSST